MPAGSAFCLRVLATLLPSEIADSGRGCLLRPSKPLRVAQTFVLGTLGSRVLAYSFQALDFPSRITSSKFFFTRSSWVAESFDGESFQWLNFFWYLDLAWAQFRVSCCVTASRFRRFSSLVVKHNLACFRDFFYNFNSKKNMER